MLVMDAVLGDADLVNEVFKRIDDPDPNVAARALVNWRAVNRTVRAATEAEARDKWNLLIYCGGYTRLLEANSGKLYRVLGGPGRNPLPIVKMFYKAYPYVKQWGPGTKRACLRVHFVADMMKDFRLEQQNFPTRMRGLPLGKWIDAQWDALEPWKKAVYEACHPHEAKYLCPRGMRVYNPN